jgi:hypothetical protein
VRILQFFLTACSASFNQNNHLSHPIMSKFLSRESFVPRTPYESVSPRNSSCVEIIARSHFLRSSIERASQDNILNQDYYTLFSSTTIRQQTLCKYPVRSLSYAQKREPGLRKRYFTKSQRIVHDADERNATRDVPCSVRSIISCVLITTLCLGTLDLPSHCANGY